MRHAITSFKLRRMPHLATVLGCAPKALCWCPLGLNRIADAYVGWGRKPSGRHAEALAQKQGKPFQLLEDGFLRSLAPAAITPHPLSIVVDSEGIYYDATAPSTLEILLQDDALFTPELLARAEAGIASLRKHRLSKYNHAPERTLKELGIPELSEPPVLVIGQTYGDASVIGALANEQSFTDMLHAALEENPSATILIKVHPEVISGQKKGYLTHALRSLSTEQQLRCHLITQQVNPWSLIEVCQSVYTVSSQMGMEALMAGKRVRCFGVPFYAGWGLTQDERPCLRRTAKRTLAELFAAAYLLYPRYLCPFTGAASTFEQTVETLALWRHINEANRLPTACVHMSGWKQKRVSQFLRCTDSGAPRPHYFKREGAAITYAKQNGGRVVSWSSRASDALAAGCQKVGVPYQRMEDGFIRSVGLGASLVQACSLVLDETGIYYDATAPNDLETLLENQHFDAETLTRAEQLITTITQAGISKYNMPAAAPFATDPFAAANSDQAKLLVVGQVENDASIRKGSPTFKHNLELLEAVRAAHPDAYLLYKPHPDVQAGLRPGHIAEAEALRHAGALYEGDILTAIKTCDALHTISSLSGFEALLRGTRVHCYGLPFYAGWGLTQDSEHCPRRSRTLTLPELVAGALIAYPRYLDPKTQQFCSPERLISALQNPPKSAGLLPRLRLYWGRCKTALHTP